jgi:RHS repeat-associated protein
VTFSTRRASYDVAGRLTSLYDGFNTSTFSWTSEGIAPTTLTYGVGGNRTTALTALHQVKQIGFSSIGPANAFARDYHYDGAGRIDQTHSPGDPTHAYTYGFDANGRLQNYDFWSSCTQSSPDSTSGIANSCSGLVSHQGYVYDNMGNRTDHGGVASTGNRYQSFNGITFVYDNDGNVSQRNDPSIANRSFYWSAESQLDSVVQNNWDHVRYDYNAFGQPVRKLRSSPSAPSWAVDSYFLWDGDQLLAEFDPSGNRRSDYLYVPGTVDQPYAHTIGATTPAGVRYQQQDQLGNVLGTMDNGNVSQTVSYDIWGKPLSVQGNTDNRLFWKGLMWEGDIVSAYYIRNRWYDPDVGRFMNEDPAGFTGGKNLYTFGGNEPVNKRDPSGLDASCQYIELPDTYFTGPNGETGIQANGYWTCSGGSGGGDGGSGGPSTYDPGHGGGGSGTSSAKKSSPILTKACGLALGNFIMSGVADGAFYASLFSGAGFAVVAMREGAYAGTFVRGSLQNLLFMARSKAMSGVAIGKAVGATTDWYTVDTWNSLAIQSDDVTWHDFIPGAATYKAYKTIAPSCH